MNVSCGDPNLDAIEVNLDQETSVDELVSHKEKANLPFFHMRKKKGNVISLLQNMD